jgi:hypothetical protein
MNVCGMTCESCVRGMCDNDQYCKINLSLPLL